MQIQTSRVTDKLAILCFQYDEWRGVSRFITLKIPYLQTVPLATMERSRREGLNLVSDELSGSSGLLINTRHCARRSHILLVNNYRAVGPIF
jgi:hypothetical protein